MPFPKRKRGSPFGCPDRPNARKRFAAPVTGCRCLVQSSNGIPKSRRCSCFSLCIIIVAVDVERDAPTALLAVNAEAPQTNKIVAESTQQMRQVGYMRACGVLAFDYSAQRKFHLHANWHPQLLRSEADAVKRVRQRFRSRGQPHGCLPLNLLLPGESNYWKTWASRLR